MLAVVVFQDVEYGDAVTWAPRLFPSNLNCTPATLELLLEALAKTGIVPKTVKPFAGAVIETVGGGVEPPEECL